MNLGKKIIYSVASLVLIPSSVFANDNQLFQSMDNSVGIGYSYNSLHAYNPDYADNAITTNSSNLNLHLERLFDSNVWMAIDGDFVSKASQHGQDGAGFSTNIQSFGFPASISAKGGYSFNWNDLGLQIVPYVQLGRQLNYNGYDVFNNGFTSSYYNQYALGGRVEYVFVPEASVYLDQSIGYLQDPNNTVTNLSAMNYVTQLGVKYNATNYFQVALQGMFSQTNAINANQLSYDPITYDYKNTNQYAFGGMILFSYLYNHDQLFNKLANPISAPNVATSVYRTTLFDNNYSLGYGFLSAQNQYKSGNSPTINSNVEYLNFNVTHEFDNQVWSQINAQLITSISQNNVPSSRLNNIIPTYIGFPGSVITNNGYAFHAGSDFAVIPYADFGILMNMNSYNLRSNTSLTNALSSDMYLQYGGGTRAEYVVSDFWQIYADQLFAAMHDRSTLNLNAWRSTTSLGVVINPYSILQFGIKGFYDSINPTGNTYSNLTDTYVPATQNSLGLQFDIGLRY